MATLVFFHAHPDDEAIATAGTMLKASEAGHRVVLVVATGGELGEVPQGLLDEGETLGQRRKAEVHAAAEILGIQRVEFLGYHDSGMEGDPSNDDPDCFWQADVDTAADQLCQIIQDENTDVLTIYDPHGVTVTRPYSGPQSRHGGCRQGRHLQGLLGDHEPGPNSSPAGGPRCRYRTAGGRTPGDG